MNVLKGFKSIEGAYPLVRGHATDAGIDVRIPEGLTSIKINGLEVSGEGEWVISPKDNILISSGWVLEIPVGYAMMVCNRSSIASKKGLTYGAHVCDAGYSGEVLINLINNSNNQVTLKCGDKIAQLVIVPVITPSIQEVATLEEVYSQKTLRGNDGFGSTGG